MTTPLRLTPYGSLLNSRNQHITLYGKRHREAAAIHPELRGHPDWDKFYDTFKHRFVSVKTPQNRRLFYDSIQSGDIILPSGYVLNMDTMRIINAKTAFRDDGQFRSAFDGFARDGSTIYNLQKEYEKENPPTFLQHITEGLQPVFLQKGRKYNITHSVSYHTTMRNRYGEMIRHPWDRMLTDTLTPTQDMTKEEVEKYMIENVLMPMYNRDSEPHGIHTISMDAIPSEQVELENIAMGSIKLLYKSIDNNLEGREGQCVIDYMLSEFQKDGSNMKHITRQKLIHDLGSGNITTAKIIRYVAQFKYVSVYALDPFFKTFKQYNAENPHVWLYFVVNNGHCYSITNETQRRLIAKYGKLELSPMKMPGNMEEALYFKGEGNEKLLEFIDKADKNVAVPFQNLEGLAKKIIQHTGTIIESFNYYDGRLSAFRHPTKDIYIIAAHDWKERREVCEKYFAEHRVIDFKWANQQWGSIGHLIMENCYGVVPKSYYSPELKQILESYPITPYRMCETREKLYGDVSIDIRRCYTSILINNDEPWNVFGAFDYVRPYKYDGCFTAGEYYIATEFFMGRGTILVQPKFYPMKFVKYCLMKEYILPKDITHVIYADRCLPADTFKKFATDMNKMERGKDIVNMLIGCLGSLYAKSTQGAITTDLRTALACATKYSGAELVALGEMYLIQHTTKTLRDFGDVPIYRQIIASSIINLDKMVEALNPEQILSYNTDSIKIRGSYNQEVIKPDAECEPGEYRIEEKDWSLWGKTIDELRDVSPPEFVYGETPVVEMDEKDMNVDNLLNGGVVVGMPGCGKSHLILQLWKNMTEEQRKKTCVVGFTCAAASNLRKRGIPTADTLKAITWDGTKMKGETLDAYEMIILDEFNMLPPYEMSLILLAQKRVGLKVLCFGDSNQCKAPVENWIDYVKNPVFLEMCNNLIVKLEYKEGFARYDRSLYEALVRFNKTKVLNIPQGGVESYSNICYTNATRLRVNNECLNRWVKENGAKLVKVGKLNIAENQPVMAYNDTDKKNGIYKTDIWRVKSIGANIVVEREGQSVSLSRGDFAKIFDYSFCFTTHKVQGMTIEGHYNIYDAERMTADILYTALSRGTKLENIHVVSKKVGRYCDSQRERTIKHRLQAVQLSKGLIYRIRLEDDSTYVGRTTGTIEDRMKEHLENPSNEAMRELLNERATIETLCEFKYSSKDVFAEIERQYIEAEIALGGVVRNVQHNTTTAKKPVKTKSMTKPKISILEDISKKRLIIRLRREGIDEADKIRYFPFKNDKAAAYADAEKWRDALLMKYF